MKFIHTLGVLPVAHVQPQRPSDQHSPFKRTQPVCCCYSLSFGFLLLCVYLQKLKFNEVIKIRLLVYDIKAVHPGKCLSGAFWLMSQVPSRCRAGERQAAGGRSMKTAVPSPFLFVGGRKDRQMLREQVDLQSG